MFQFTHPGRGATIECFTTLAVVQVSIHAPREGCDYSSLLCRVSVRRFQFTHPGRGATSGASHSPSGSRRFNSRTPGGVRLLLILSALLPLGFNSRTPGGVRRANAQSLSNMREQFQFTHPGRGATVRTSFHHLATRSFNSRTPGGVRQCGAKLRIIGRINKRNLREGR